VGGRSRRAKTQAARDSPLHPRQLSPRVHRGYEAMRVIGVRVTPRKLRLRHTSLRY